jgi:hypothetical protein
MEVYPKIKRIHEVDIREFLCQPIYCQIKRDGSNIGCYLNDDKKLTIRSRGQDIAKDDLRAIFDSCLSVKNVEDFLRTYPKSTVFIELMAKGKSPARFELHETNHFVVIDIHDGVKWLSPLNTFFTCCRFSIPHINISDISYHSTIDSLYEYADEKLKMYPEYEGIVIKNTYGAAFKHKNKIPTHAKKKEMVKLTFDILPDADVYTTIHKVLMDLEYDERKNVKIAMEKIGRAIGIECKESGTRPPKRLFDYYIEVLEGLN